MGQTRRRLVQLSLVIVHHISTLSLLARGALLTFSLLTAVTAVTTLARPFGHESPSDPFTVYAAIFPAQRIDSSTLIKRGFSCATDTLPSPADVTEHCAYALMTGTLSAINVVIWDGVVERLDFILRREAFAIGDLALLWGNPDIHQAGQWVSLNWPERHINGSSWSEDGQFSYFQSVMQLSFGV